MIALTMAVALTATLVASKPTVSYKHNFPMESLQFVPQAGPGDPPDAPRHRLFLVADKSTDRLWLKMYGQPPIKGYIMSDGLDERINRTPTGWLEATGGMTLPPWNPSKRIRRSFRRVDPTFPQEGPIKGGDKRNALGYYCFYFNHPWFRLHGTNKEGSIGPTGTGTAGCLKITNLDALEVATLVVRHDRHIRGLRLYIQD